MNRAERRQARRAALRALAKHRTDATLREHVTHKGFVLNRKTIRHMHFNRRQEAKQL